MTSDDLDDVYRDFTQAVNMAPSELGEWRSTDASRSVGVVDGDKKSKFRAVPSLSGTTRVAGLARSRRIDTSAGVTLMNWGQ